MLQRRLYAGLYVRAVLAIDVDKHICRRKRVSTTTTFWTLGGSYYSETSSKVKFTLDFSFLFIVCRSINCSNWENKLTSECCSFFVWKSFKISWCSLEDIKINWNYALACALARVSAGNSMNIIGLFIAWLASYNMNCIRHWSEMGRLHARRCA